MKSHGGFVTANNRNIDTLKEEKAALAAEDYPPEKSTLW